MTLDEIAKKLEAQRTTTIKNGWTLAQTKGDETYGLNYTRVQEVARDLDSDAVLADELYASTNHDMKVLATLIDDPKSYTLDELNQRAEQLYPSPFAEKFCKQVLAHTVHAVYFINKWLDCEDCNLQAYAYITLAEIARMHNNLSDEFFSTHLDSIATGMQEEPADIKIAMRQAILSISHRNEKLRKKAIDAVHRIGDVVHDKKGKASPIFKLDKMHAVTPALAKI